MVDYLITDFQVASVDDAIIQIISKIVSVGWTDDTGGIAHSAADSYGRKAYLRLTKEVAADTYGYIKTEVSNDILFAYSDTITKYAYLNSAMTFPQTVKMYAHKHWATLYFAASDANAAYRTSFGLYESIHTGAEDTKPVFQTNPRTTAGGTAAAVQINTATGKWYAFGSSWTETECGIFGYNQSGNWNQSNKTVPVKKIYVQALLRTGSELIGGYLYDCRMLPFPTLNEGDIIHDIDTASIWYVLRWSSTSADNICVRIQ